MKRSTALTILLAMAAAVVVYSFAAEKEVSVTGEVIDSACYIKMGAKGAGHAECATNCAKAGIPLAILEDKTDKVWMVASDKDAESGNVKLDQYIAKKVTAKGKTFERGGQRILAITSVQPAS